MTTMIRIDNGVMLERLGAVLIRYALVIVLLWVGSLKFTAYEAMGVHEHAVNSPLLAWLANMMSTQSFSEVIGTIEIILGILIAIKPYAPRASFFGSIGAIIMFLLRSPLYLPHLVYGNLDMVFRVLRLQASFC